MFPAATWSRLQPQAWREVSPGQLSYATGAGKFALCEAMAEYLQSTRGAVCTPAQVVIESGTQRAWNLVAQLLADPGDPV
jgi:GntR family transcriptional regulator/MocR family aminotransferase